MPPPPHGAALLPVEVSSSLEGHGAPAARIKYRCGHKGGKSRRGEHFPTLVSQEDGSNRNGLRGGEVALPLPALQIENNATHVCCVRN